MKHISFDKMRKEYIQSCVWNKFEIIIYRQENFLNIWHNKYGYNTHYFRYNHFLYSKSVIKKYNLKQCSMYLH